MFKDVEFIAPHTVVMTKKLWAENELAFAGCLALPFDPSSGSVTANLYLTTRRALYEFLTLSFRNFMHNPDNQHFRDRFFEQTKASYEAIERDIYDNYITKANFYERFYLHQNDTLVKIIPSKHNLVSLEQQLGKSCVSAAKSQILSLRRTVIVCPASLKWKWMMELVRNWGYNQLHFTILDTARSRSITALHEKYIIINYEIVGQYMKYLTSRPIDHVIFDECTRLKNTNSLRWKHCKTLADSAGVADGVPNMHITLLSGTPVQNRINDVFAYYKLIGNPLANNYAQFLRDYTEAKVGRGGATKITGGKNLEDLRVRMSNFMIRRTRKDCMDLPPEIIGIARFELGDYKEEYDRIVLEMIQNRTIKNLDSCLQSLNIVTAKSKIPGMIDIIEGVIEEGRKYVCFCPNTEPLHLLAEHFGKRAVLIDGKVRSDQRNILSEQFINDPDTWVMLANPQAGGEGWSWQVCSDLGYLSLPMTHKDFRQSKDRIQGIGQKNSVSITIAMCEGSVDEVLYKMIASKDTDANTLLDGGKNAIDYDNMAEVMLNQIIENYKKDHPEYHGKTEVKPDEGVSPGELHTDNAGEQEVLSGHGAYDPCDPPEL